MGFSTKQIHAGVEPDTETGSILTPIYQSTTFVQPSVDEYLSKGYSYSRSGNPTVRALERKLNALEEGFDCTCYATGMAAIQVVMQACLNAGDHAIISDVAYGGTYRLATKVFSRFGVEFSFVNTADAAVVEAAVKPNTRLILTETPANPNLKLTDIQAVSEIARVPGHPARGGQYVPYALLSAAAGTGRRHLHSQHDQVLRRSQRDRGRRRDCRHRSPG